MKFVNKDGAEDVGEVWSPGPYAASVWLVDGRCVKRVKGAWVEVAGQFENARDVGRYLLCGSWLGSRESAARQVGYLDKWRYAPRMANTLWAEVTR
ncbi:hypothetical protein [Amycolatopsis sp. NPDC003731]